MRERLRRFKNFIISKFNNHLDNHSKEEFEILKHGLEALETLREKNKAIQDLSKKGLSFMKRLRERHRIEKEFNKRLRISRRGNFQWYHTKVRYSRLAFLVLNLIIIYMLFRYIGFSFISYLYITLFTIGGVMQMVFLISIENRILLPLQRLNRGVEEIAKGNYEVKVESQKNSEVDLVINSFNEMAKKLKEAEELKLEYEENRKLLIANISHDLKTPITSIQGYIETISDTKNISKETLNKYHKIIYNNAGYMNKLIDDLFLFSKLDMQKLEFNFNIVSINDFMDDLMGEFSFDLEERDIDFKYKSNLLENYLVNIDINRINQVFRNIFGNAIKHGLKEDSKVEVILYKNNDMIAVDIKDNGEGISEDDLPFIFDRFYRVDVARTKDLMSTGLGLAISKELIEAHGGSIKVTSSKGFGTCFTVELPIENL